MKNFFHKQYFPKVYVYIFGPKKETKQPPPPSEMLGYVSEMP